MNTVSTSVTTTIYKKILLTLFNSLRWLNLRFYDDLVFTKYHTFIGLSFLFYLNFYGLINLLAIYQVIQQETGVLLIAGAVIIVITHAYYLFYKKYFTTFLEDRKSVKPWHYLILILFVVASFSFAFYTSDLYRATFYGF